MGGSRISAHALPQEVLIVLYMYRITGILRGYTFSLFIYAYNPRKPRNIYTLDIYPLYGRLYYIYASIKYCVLAATKM